MVLSAETYEQIVRHLKSDAPRESDKRKFPRVGVRASVTVIHSRAGKIVEEPFRLRDFSAGGLGFLSHEPMPLNTQIMLRLPRTAARPMVLRCRVRHCQKVAGDLFSIGVGFEAEETAGAPALAQEPKPAVAAKA